MKHLLKSFQTSFRAQLIYGIGFFLTLLLSAFIYIETSSNNEFTRLRAMQIASNHSKALSSMVKVWVMSNDYVGMEEALDNFSVYNDLVFATVIDMDGKVLVHTDKALVKTYVADERRIAFLEESRENSENDLELIREGHNIDVLRVIHNGDKHIGFVHLRLDQQIREEKITYRIYQGIGFGLLFLLSTIGLLFIIVNAFTKQLSYLLEIMKKVHEGNKEVKADTGGYNEFSQLALEFNGMLDAISSGEKSLEMIKERLEYAIKGSQDGIWDWDLQTNEVYFSPRWKEMIGYSDDELPNTFETWENRVYPEDLEQAKRDILLCHSTVGQLYSNSHRMRHKDGSIVWILARAQTIFNEEGKAIRMVGFHTDITKQKELEQELLQQEEMMIIQSRHVAMGEMIGNISHQWRQPLNALGLIIQKLVLFNDRGLLDNEKLKASVEKSMQLINTMSNTIDDFRDFFNPKKEKSVFVISKTIEKAHSIIASSLENHSVSYSIESSDQDLSIKGFENEFAQVIINLLNNAKDVLVERKTEHAAVKLKVYSTDTAICVDVCDNAGGIEPEVLKKVFEPYFTTKQEGKGTGIGLYMSKTIIEEHMQGTLSVRNSTEGACFNIHLPILNAEKKL